jgi:hypothetical protein
MNDKALAELMVCVKQLVYAPNHIIVPTLNRLVAAEHVIATEHVYPSDGNHRVADCPKCCAMRRWMDIREGHAS